MKILYAAGNRVGSYEQLKRYIPLFKNSKHDFFISGYKKHLKDINADFCLDSLLDFSNPNGYISFNGNYFYYSKELNKLDLDIVISDFDIHTSLYAIDKNIPLWQVSPAILYHGLPLLLKREIGVHKYNSNIISGDRARHQYIKNILNNSSRKLILSHLCDIEHPPELLDKYEWCRPEFKLNYDEGSEKIISSNGTGVSLADAFYNEKFTELNMSEIDVETITGISCNSYFNLGKLSPVTSVKKINININYNVKFLMELLK